MIHSLDRLMNFTFCHIYSVFIGILIIFILYIINAHIIIKIFFYQRSFCVITIVHSIFEVLVKRFADVWHHRSVNVTGRYTAILLQTLKLKNNRYQLHCSIYTISWPHICLSGIKTISK